MNEALLTSIPATAVRFRFVSATRIVGLSGLPENRDLPLDRDRSEARGFLTLDPNPALAAVDRGAILGFLMLSAFQGKRTGPEILSTAESMRRDRATERLKDSSAVFLIVEALGEQISTPTNVVRDLGDAVLAFDAVNKAAIKAAYQPLVNAALSAVALTLNTTSDVVHILDGVELKLPDGRPLYSFTASIGSVRMTTARPVTVEDAQNFQTAIRALLTDNRLVTPSRLWSDAIRSGNDRLEAFIFAWAALEILIGKYTVGCENGAWISSVPQDHRAGAESLHRAFLEGGHQYYSLADRAKVFALIHALTDRGALSAELTHLRTRFREPLYHAGVIAEQDLPVEAVIGLAKRLLARAAHTRPNEPPRSSPS